LSTLEERLDQDLKASLKERDALRRSVVQMLRSLILLEKKKGSEAAVDDALVVRLVQGHARKLAEALELAEKAGRADLVERTRREIAVTESYLPAPLGEAELQRLVAEVVAGLAERGPKAMGSAMKEVLARAGGRADGKRVQAAVRAALGLG
jgi:hypothetical protein